MIIHNPILTGSLVFNGTNLTTSNLVTTGSNNFTGSQAISGSLNVTGNITATTLVVQTVSSSVIYSSGSNVFGNNIANTQTFTGSMLVTGSSTILGNLGVGGTPGERLSVTGPLGLQGFIRWSDGVSTSAFLGITGSTAFIHANNNILAFGANGSNNFAATMTITGSSVGIGSNPISGRKLTLTDSGGSYLVYANTGAGARTYTSGVDNYGYIIYDDTAAAYRMSIRASGYVGIGTTNPSSLLTLLSTAASKTTIGQSRFLDINDNTGLTNAKMEIGFGYTNLGTLTNVPAVIGFHQMTTSGNTYGDIYFATRNVTTDTAPIERMRITSAGVIKVGDDSSSRPIMQYSNFGYGSAWKTVIVGSSNSNYTTDGVTLCFNVDVSGNTSGAYSGDGREYVFRNVGSFITPNSSNNGYNTLMSWNSSGVVTVTTSDYRAKEDLKSFNALPMIEAIKLYDFRWIELQDRMHGVLAHELQEIVPYAVHGEKDGERMQGVDYSKLVPIMLKAIQELKAEIEILKTK